MKLENDILNMQKLSESELDFVVGGANSDENPDENPEEDNEQMPSNPLPNINISPAAAIGIVVYTVATWVYATYRLVRGSVWIIRWCCKKFGVCADPVSVANL